MPPAPEEAAKTQPAEETQPGPDFGTPAGVAAILASAGFCCLRTEVQTEEIAYRSEEEWWSVSWSHGGRQPLEDIERKAGPGGLQRYKAEAFEHLQPFRIPEGFPERLEVVLAVGEKE